MALLWYFKHMPC